MQYRKEKIIGVLEMMGTMLLIYFHWVTLYNMFLTNQVEEFNTIMGFVMFMLYFVILLSSASVHFLHMNPITTLAFWLFGLTKLKNVS